MHAGRAARLDRIGTDGRMVNIPMDHGITIGATDGLRDIESTGCPVIVADGSPRSDEAMLEQVRGAMDAGVAGVSMGRSAFQHDDPEAFVGAVAGVVHEDASVESALDGLVTAPDGG